MHLSGKSLWDMVAEQFEDLLVRILLLAACVSFVSTTQLIKTTVTVIRKDHWFYTLTTVIYTLL